MLRRPSRFIPPLGPPRRSARQRALAELHGLDLAPLEKIKERPALSASAVLPQVLGRIRMDQRQAEAEIVRVWNNLIDPTITAHARPDSIAGGTLFVNVDNSVWLDEIVRYRRKEILALLQHSFGRELVKRISFRIG